MPMLLALLRLLGVVLALLAGSCWRLACSTARYAGHYSSLAGQWRSGSRRRYCATRGHLVSRRCGAEGPRHRGRSGGVALVGPGPTGSTGLRDRLDKGV